MPRNGVGTYTLPAGNPVVSGTVISSTVQNNTTSDIATALTASIANDGQTPILANIPMSGFKFTGLAAGTTAGDSVRYEQFAAPPSIGSTTPASGAFTTLTASGDVAVNTNKFTVAATTGNTVVAGTLGITGDVAVNTNKLTVTASNGNLTSAGDITGVGGVFTTVTSNGVGIAPCVTSITASVATNALTVNITGTSINFRNTTATNGAFSIVSIPSTISVVVPSGATLGTTNGVAARITVLAINNAGTAEVAVINNIGGVNLDESGTIDTTAIDTAADNTNIAYSTTARTGVAYRVVGYIDITEATAGTWASSPTTVQGIGGKAGNTTIWLGSSTATTSGTSVDLTGIPTAVRRITLLFDGVSTNGTSAIMLRIGDGSIVTSGYNAFGFGFTGVSYASTTYTAGFGIQNAATAADGHYGSFIFNRSDSNKWMLMGNGSCGTTATGFVCGGSKTLTGTLDRIRITTAGGTDTFDAGSVNISWEF